jgi:eukaryotic-like serine/threonine-protein kinase
MTTAPPSTFGAGTEYGPYRIERQVGRGAFGIVYEALRNPLKKRFALKILHEHVLSTPDAITRFQREIMAAAQVEHPHVIQVFDGGVSDERGFLAMEFLDGETLGEKLKRDGAFTVEETVDIMLPIASALDAVHNAGVVHRDIKPGNIFLARHITGVTYPKLVDFGIAKLLSDDLDLTQTHSWLGTPFYMSPEQVRQSKSIDARSDQWSLAVVIYELLTNEKPFRNEVLLDLLEAITSQTPPAPSTLVSSVPKGLDTVIARMMERDPARRFPSMRAAGAALWPFASPRMRAIWARHFDHEGDALSRLPDVIEARDSGMLGNAASMQSTTIHVPEKNDPPTLMAKVAAEAPKVLAAKSVEPPPSPWPYAIGGTLLGMTLLFVGQQLTATPPAVPVTQPQVTAEPTPHIEAPSVVVATPTPPTAPQPVAVAVLPDVHVVVATADVVTPRIPDAPSVVALNTNTARVSSTASPGVTSVRGAPYCDDDPQYHDACTLLQSGNRSGALSALHAIHSPRSLIAQAHILKQSGRLVDAEEKLELALREGGDAWMSSHSSFSNALLAEVQSRLGSIEIACTNGEVVIGSEGASRRYNLPRSEPVRSPTGHVQVVITTNGNSLQQYVDVRTGQTAHVTSCGVSGN